MKTKRVCQLLAVLFGLHIVSSYSIESNTSDEEMAQEAGAIVKKFAGQLKPQLKKALQDGGISNAIKVCSTLAPEIGRSLTNETDWLVKRVSLKPRNKNNATADEWEQSVLMSFNQRQVNGEMISQMVRAERVGGRYRFMKAQGVEPLCLNCHGSNLNAESRAALATHYPDDVATGYSLGQVRGAFSLSKRLK